MKLFLIVTHFKLEIYRDTNQLALYNKWHIWLGVMDISSRPDGNFLVCCRFYTVELDYTLLPWHLFSYFNLPFYTFIYRLTLWQIRQKNNNPTITCYSALIYIYVYILSWKFLNNSNNLSGVRLYNLSIFCSFSPSADKLNLPWVDVNLQRNPVNPNAL